MEKFTGQKKFIAEIAIKALLNYCQETFLQRAAVNVSQFTFKKN
jgi:hypothetical protein